MGKNGKIGKNWKKRDFARFWPGGAKSGKIVFFMVWVLNFRRFFVIFEGAGGAKIRQIWASPGPPENPQIWARNPDFPGSGRTPGKRVLKGPYLKRYIFLQFFP